VKIAIAVIAYRGHGSVASMEKTQGNGDGLTNISVRIAEYFPPSFRTVSQQCAA
jgi:hypothetical protein